MRHQAIAASLFVYWNYGHVMLTIQNMFRNINQAIFWTEMYCVQCAIKKNNIKNHTFLAVILHHCLYNVRQKYIQRKFNVVRHLYYVIVPAAHSIYLEKSAHVLRSLTSRSINVLTAMAEQSIEHAQNKKNNIPKFYIKLQQHPIVFTADIKNNYIVCETFCTNGKWIWSVIHNHA